MGKPSLEVPSCASSHIHSLQNVTNMNSKGFHVLTQLPTAEPDFKYWAVFLETALQVQYKQWTTWWQEPLCTRDKDRLL